MRIAGGAGKGRRLGVARRGTRPTRALIRTAIFNVIGHFLADARALDIFAGSGALGIEALARGARTCHFIEKRPRELRENLARMAFGPRSVVMAEDFRPALKRLKGREFDLVFLDPPYGRGYISTALHLIRSIDLLAGQGLIVAEYAGRDMINIPDGLAVIWSRSYGETVISLVEHKGAP